MGTDRARPNLTLVIPAAGLLFGIATSMVDHAGGVFAVHLSKIIGGDWAWIAVGLAACAGGRTWWRAWGRGCACLIPAVLGYYVSDLLAYLVYDAITKYQVSNVPLGGDPALALVSWWMAWVGVVACGAALVEGVVRWVRARRASTGAFAGA